MSGLRKTCLFGFGVMRDSQVLGLIALPIGSVAWRWLAVVASSLVVAGVVDLLARNTISRRLAGGAAIAAGALAATVVGYLLFPPIRVSSPHSTTFSVVGALVCSVYWLMVTLFLPKPREVRREHYLRLCRVFLLSGIVAGLLTGLLSGQLLSGLLFCTPLGLLGGLLLAAPHFLMVITRRRKQSGD